MSDGPHGLRVQAPDTASLDLHNSIPATCFPPAVGLGSTWNSALTEMVGAALGREARALGVDILLGPGINIKRSPLCGRNFEYFSEDPYVSGRLGTAMVNGLQSVGVGASLKHFAANNQETDRMRVDAIVDERTLREIYLRAFEMVVTNAQPWTVMCSYNLVNGTPASNNAWLLTDVLRNEWGFGGLVVSDWGAVYNRVDSVKAGLDLEMPHGSDVSDQELESAIEDGSIDLAAVDTAAGRVIALSERAAAARAEFPPTEIDVDAHHSLALDAARQAPVLLKNDGATLPISPERQRGLVIVGEFAEFPRYQGSGSSRVTPTRLDAALEWLRKLSSADSQPQFARGFHTTHPENNDALRAEAVSLCTGAEDVIMFLGLPEAEESEGFDRTHLELPRAQTDLLAAIAAVAGRVTVVLSNGGAVAVSAWEESANAILEGWLLGQAGGRATAEILLGVVSPSGRLTETIPERLADVPSFLNFPGSRSQVRYGERVYVGYRGYDTTESVVSYPFGHGLTYSRFEYSDLRISVTETPDGPSATITATITNTGSVSAAEVVQLYVAPIEPTVDRPAHELKGFDRIELEPGASAIVTFELDPRDFAFWSERDSDWSIDTGAFRIEVGASSRDIRLTEFVDVVGTQKRVPLTPLSTLGEWMRDPAGIATLASIEGFAEVTNLGDVEETTVRMLEDIPLSKIAGLAGVSLTRDGLDQLVAAANARAAG